MRALFWRPDGGLAAQSARVAGSGASAALQTARRSGCRECRYTFTVITGTAIQGSKLPLGQWVAAMALMGARRKGVPSTELARLLGLTQKTAWFMLHRIRQMMAAHAPALLEGQVMADETYVGGLQKNRHKNKKKPAGSDNHGRTMWGKVPVMGVMSAAGQVFSRPIANVKSQSLYAFIYANVRPLSQLVTDDFQGYKDIEQLGYSRQVVNHDKGQYVNEGGATTNPLESYWSHLKRTIKGCHHSVLPKHLWRYCAAQDFRHNTIGMQEWARVELIYSRPAQPVGWKGLRDSRLVT